MNRTLPEPELSVVMPCLNDADTLTPCLAQVRAVLSAVDVNYEIVVADNGSSDGSQTLARRLDARVVHVQAKGYGHTVMAGVAASRGRYVLLVDADNRYALDSLPRFLVALREGALLVQGCRLPSGGGRVEPGAMSWLHQRLVVPFFSLLAGRWFRSPVRDIFCGLRGFTREAYERWALRCIGLEFATEMIIKASLHHDVIAEVPVTYCASPARERKPHLRNLRDGWRTFRLFLISCPRWLFVAPGAVAMLLGFVGYYLGYANVSVGRVRFDINTILLASLLIIIGYQAVLFAGYTLLFALNERFLPLTARVRWWCERINMERGFVIGMTVLLAGLGFLAAGFFYWRSAGYGAMPYQGAMRRIIPGVTLTALGFQTILSGAFMSILGMYRRSAQVQAPDVAVAPEPWLSVIVPTYQGGSHLDSALSSIAMQNDGGIEVLLIDDGSTDALPEVVKAWEGILPMRVIWRDRSGNWVNSTNVGLSEARGEWVCMLHQDDVWKQNRIPVMRDLIRRYPDVNFFFHAVDFINEGGWPIGRWKAPLPSLTVCSPAHLLTRLIAQDFIAINAPVFRKSLYQRVGGMDESLWYHSDWDFWLRMVAEGPVVYCSDSLASFRLHRLSQTAKRTSDLADVGGQIDQVVCKALAMPAFPKTGLERTERMLRFHRAFYLCLLAVVHKQKGPLRDCMKAAWTLGPMGLLRYVYWSRIFDRVWPRLRLFR